MKGWGGDMPPGGTMPAQAAPVAMPAMNPVDEQKEALARAVEEAAMGFAKMGGAQYSEKEQREKQKATDEAIKAWQMRKMAEVEAQNWEPTTKIEVG